MFFKKIPFKKRYKKQNSNLSHLQFLSFNSKQLNRNRQWICIKKNNKIIKDKMKKEINNTINSIIKNKRNLFY